MMFIWNDEFEKIQWNNECSQSKLYWDHWIKNMSKRKFEQIDQGSIVVYHENKRLIFFIQGNKNVKIIQCMWLSR